MSIGFHHYFYQNKRFNTWLTRCIYVFSVIGNLAILPQVMKIWIDRDTAGVSALTWTGFLIGSVFWLCYGLVHREKVIVLSNSLAICGDLAIISGLLLFGK